MSDPDLTAVDSDDPALQGREYMAARAILAALNGKPTSWLEKAGGLTAEGKPRVHRQVAWQLTTKPRRAMPSDDIIEGLGEAFGWSEAWTRNLFAVTTGAVMGRTLEFAGLVDPVVDGRPIEWQMQWAKLLNQAAADHAAAHPES